MPAAASAKEMSASEKQMFLQSFERESATTLKVLKAFPADRGDYKPHEKSRSAKDLAWTFVMEQGLATGALNGSVDFSQPMPKAPADYHEVVAAFERGSRDTLAKIAAASDEDLNRMMKFPVAPKTMADLRRIDVLWTALMDQVHHRGQFSVYLRLVGSKVPSIYGPTADEPWV
jgi:uncharacterized damage-inducible protein DinB